MYRADLFRTVFIVLQFRTMEEEYRLEDIERITEAFYMVDKSRSRSEHGAGLGLALVSRIAKLHDTKSIMRVSRKGTRVYFDMKAEALDEK